MGIIFSQSAHDEVISVPAGVTTGVILLTRNNVTFRGVGESSIIRGDTTRAYMIDAGVIVGGGPCTRVTFEDLTIDAANLSSMVAVIAANQSGGPVTLVLRRVRITNYSKSTIAITSSAAVVLDCVTIVGNGLALQINSGLYCFNARCVTVTGGVGGLIAGGAPGTVRGINVDTMTIALNFWMAPTFEEVTPTAFAAQHVDVASHVAADRSPADAIVYFQKLGTYTVGAALPASAREHDRADLADGRWGEVRGRAVIWRAANQWHEIAEPTGETATLYRTWLGKMRGWSMSAPHQLRLSLDGAAPLGHWRGVEGTPTLVRGATEADATANTITLEGHGFTTGDGPVYVKLGEDVGGALPGGLAPATAYYVIRVDDDTIKLATSSANALAGTAVDITAVGAGDFAVLRVPTLAAGSKMRIIRHGIVVPGVQPRDMDSGGVHITDASAHARMVNVIVEGAASDGYTSRDSGRDNYHRNCTVKRTWDMAITLGGGAAVPQNVFYCEATAAGYKGVYLAPPMSNIVMCYLHDNGLHDEGGHDSNGISADVGVAGAVSVRGNGGRDGMIKDGAALTRAALTSYVDLRVEESC